MHKLLKITNNITFSLLFLLNLTLTSTTLVNYSLKGKSYYIQPKTYKNQINISSITEHIESYSIDTRNNTSYLTITSSLNKDEALALLTGLYVSLNDNTYPLQVIFQYKDGIFFASITTLGISIS